MDTANLKRTPLNEVHRAAGAKMVDFGGWDMPVQYTGLIDEHNTVRTAAGLFDVSHMGEIEVRGPQALQLVDYVTTTAISNLKHGQAKYTALLYDHGGFVDDILVHKVADNEFFICVNASNQDKDFAHICENNKFDCEVEFASPKYAQLALQGPRALEIAQTLTGVSLKDIKYYWFTDGVFAGVPARIARTGYTGEDGIEVYVAPEFAVATWNSIMEAGKPFGIKPCGLGARNTLRLESAMALYGHEIDATINPYEADLARIVKLDKGDFVGRAALCDRLEKGITRKLFGFEMRGRGIGRDGYEVMLGGKPAGWVTSGSPAPTLNKNIGLCYLPVESKPGDKIEIMIRNCPVEAEIVHTPFYKRKSK
ncbi:MAG TPA: glycine cleavage system aminomethyltransferase GcvT [Bryobacteraceae bacterium]|jgi:aminomethyltransferase|nr:glycine cleavage system aminomethyltransferase GcvT [Bryobacteraceae bacterium]